MTIKITEITEWWQDDCIMDTSHASESDWLELLADEKRAKEEDEEWTEGLPFVYETKTNSEEEAVQEAIEAYAGRHCDGDILQPIEADYEIVFND